MLAFLSKNHYNSYLMLHRTFLSSSIYWSKPWDSLFFVWKAFKKYVHAAWFPKKCSCLKLKIFFIWRNNHNLTKVIIFSEKSLKIKGDDAEETFPDLADLSNYLTLKFMHEKELAQYVLDCKCRRLQQQHLGKILKNSTT